MKTVTFDDSKWKLVPIESTPEMQTSALPFVMRLHQVRQVWANMLDKSPTPGEDELEHPVCQECIEQSRLLGMGAERELALKAQVQSMQKLLYRTAIALEVCGDQWRASDPQLRIDIASALATCPPEQNTESEPDFNQTLNKARELLKQIAILADPFSNTTQIYHLAQEGLDHIRATQKTLNG